MMEAHDGYYIFESKGDFDRTIGISTVVKFNNGTEKQIRTSDFDVTQEEIDLPYQHGGDG